VVLGHGPEISLDDLPLSPSLRRDKNDRETLSYREAVKTTKRDVVLRALAQTGGNRAAPARLLGSIIYSSAVQWTPPFRLAQLAIFYMI
jgi:transcriptional regulator with GAF, ATPase, and Fis domain